MATAKPKPKASAKKTNPGGGWNHLHRDNKPVQGEKGAEQATQKYVSKHQAARKAATKRQRPAASKAGK